jgi:hypothetical protein
MGLALKLDSPCIAWPVCRSGLFGRPIAFYP